MSSKSPILVKSARPVGSSLSGGFIWRRWRAMTAGRKRPERDTYPGLQIARLPEELLAEVFYWYILDVCIAAARCSYSSIALSVEESSYKHLFCAPKPYSWIIIRHVCRVWRQVALTYPRLSTHIFLTRPECVEDLLSRAGTLPLHIYDPGFTYVRKNLDCVAASCRRVQTHIDRISHGTLILENSAANANCQASVSPAKICKAQSLRILFLSELFSASNTLPPDLHFPELQDLSCYNYAITALRPMLTALQLRTLKLAHCNPIPASDLIALLGPLQALEELVLDMAILTDEDWPHLDGNASTELQHKITLPNLRALRLTDTCAATGLYFLHRIVRPPTTSLHLSFIWLSQVSHISCDCLSTLVFRMVDDWSHLEASPIRTLQMSGSSGASDYFNLRLWQTRQPVSRPDPPGTGSPFFQLSAQSGQRAVFAGLLRRLPLAGVKSALVLQWTVGWNVVDWETLFGAMPALEELALYYELVDTSRSPRHVFAPRDTRALCPRLKVLHVHESHPRHAHCGHLHVPIVPEDLPPDFVTLAHFGRGFALRGEHEKQTGDDQDALIVHFNGDTRPLEDPSPPTSRRRRSIFRRLLSLKSRSSR
ncbi:uncharacterized protein PHACADRAFT_203493 [Phanerochaete carnosa HHB-10118-sp]|uniref:F-box domain-containing protein n=1 Tax=Phanerochaete carnosa (strain HHB-10118-sp) TaxID=650164 RepID=K5XBB3_PHACS|nr:uncharacterized protein PHACADRAFT_203493 [Phanerochaete carnosa HHB-10118-sp]EKM60247.1 hypothetical protein PHACADRAFT_203493 [Phanerochaete carnosa HHB-10118-sp]